MSICVAWRKGNGLRIASDSRYSNLDGSSDYGVKLLQVPVRVRAAAEVGKSPVTLYESTLGMTFAGDVLPGFMIKERLEQVLYNLQYIGSMEDFTFDKIAGICLHVYERVKDSLGDSFLKSTELIVVGCCPRLRSTHAIKLLATESGEAYMEFIPQGNDARFECLGAHVDEFGVWVDVENSIDDRDIDGTMMRAIRRMSENVQYRSIGGAVQFGLLDLASDFQTLGVVDFELEGAFLKPRMTVGGIPFEDLLPPASDCDLGNYFMSGRYIAPFQSIAEKAC